MSYLVLILVLLSAQAASQEVEEVTVNKELINPTTLKDNEPASSEIDIPWCSDTQSEVHKDLEKRLKDLQRKIVKTKNRKKMFNRRLNEYLTLKSKSRIEQEIQRIFDHVPDQEMCMSGMAQHHIVDGNPVPIEQYPWMVQVNLPRYNGSWEECGGVIISRRWILTAAHCVEIAKLLKENPELLRNECLRSTKLCNDFKRPYGIFVGKTKLINPREQPMLEAESFYTNDYDYKTYSNDIALIRLKEPLKFNDFVRPMCLPTEAEMEELATRFLIMGWGYTKFTKDQQQMSFELRAAFVQKVEKQTCITQYKEANQTMPESHFCAGGVGGKPDTCIGDSGGPIMFYSDLSGRLLPAGITSIGLLEACGKIPSGFTELRRHMCWIMKTIKDGEK